jgi:hypothetical protein
MANDSRLPNRRAWLTLSMRKAVEGYRSPKASRVRERSSYRARFESWRASLEPRARIDFQNLFVICTCLLAMPSSINLSNALDLRGDVFIRGVARRFMVKVCDVGCGMTMAGVLVWVWNERRVFESGLARGGARGCSVGVWRVCDAGAGAAGGASEHADGGDDAGGATGGVGKVFGGGGDGSVSIGVHGAGCGRAVARAGREGLQRGVEDCGGPASEFARGESGD